MKKLFLCFLLLPLVSFSQIDAKKKVLNQMRTACMQLKGAKYLLVSYERKKDGTVSYSELNVKIRTQPLQIYVYVVKPTTGAEVLWRNHEMNGHLLINPNGFPYFTLRLDPFSPLLRKNSHHTVMDLGFDYILGMVNHYTASMGEKFYSYMSVGDTVSVNGTSYIRFTFDYTDFSYKPYTVKKGENVTTIALSHYINDYMVVCANKDVSNFHDVKPGQVINIPDFFGKRVVFYLDKTTMLPLIQEVYDEKGLFEKYELKNFILNPPYAVDEFTPDHTGYGF